MGEDGEENKVERGGIRRGRSKGEKMEEGREGTNG